MAGKTTGSTFPTSPFDAAAFEDPATRVRELNERIIAHSRAAGLSSLDTYERALTSLGEFERKVAGATNLEWVTALARAHATFVQDVTAVYTKAARDLLA